MTDILPAIILTILAGAWRYADGRGKPWRETWLRNLAGVLVAVACGSLGVNGYALAPADPAWWIGPACGGLAALTLIAGLTEWPSLWSLARYGGPTCVIAVLGYLGGAPPLACALYAVGGVLAGGVYIVLHRMGWEYATQVSEAFAGALVIGGLAWL